MSDSNERLISGPGGIMEMKQTIADKEKYIEQLEVALRHYVCECEELDDCPIGHASVSCGYTVRKALEGKDE